MWPSRLSNCGGDEPPWGAVGSRGSFRPRPRAERERRSYLLWPAIVMLAEGEGRSCRPSPAVELGVEGEGRYREREGRLPDHGRDGSYHGEVGSCVVSVLVGQIRIPVVVEKGGAVG